MWLSAKPTARETDHPKIKNFYPPRNQHTWKNVQASKNIIERLHVSYELIENRWKSMKLAHI